MFNTVTSNTPAQANAALNNVATDTAANNVVLNNISSIGYSEQVFTILDTVANERAQWENNVYRASNNALYAILQKCYALDWQLSNAKVGVKAMREGINSYASKLGYKFKDSTPMLNRIVQCVFGNVHKTRISTYSYVLRAAKKQNKSIEEIPSFIENAGGVQEIRAKKSGTAKTPQEKLAIATDKAFSEVLAVVSNPELSKLADSNYAETECVLLATQQADGTFAINAVVRAKSAVNAALNAFYGENTAKIKADTADAAAANDANYRQDLIAKIIG